MKKLIEGHWYCFNDRGDKHIGQYIGKNTDDPKYGFECIVCGKGCRAHQFNHYHTDNEGDYETFSYGDKHLPTIMSDLGDGFTIIVDEL